MVSVLLALPDAGHHIIDEGGEEGVAYDENNYEIHDRLLSRQKTHLFLTVLMHNPCARHGPLVRYVLGLTRDLLKPKGWIGILHFIVAVRPEWTL